MDIKKTYPRSKVDINYTWDLSGIFKNNEEFKEMLEESEVLVDKFVKKYKGKIKNSNIINKALDDFKVILENFTLLLSFTNLSLQVDNTNRENMARYMETSQKVNELNTKISFLKGEILKNEEDIIKKAMKESKENENTLKSFLEEKPLMQSEDVEKVLSQLDMTFNSFYRIYDAAKLQDMSFPNFIVNGKEYELSYNIFENQLEGDLNTKIRREAFKNFSNKLEEYKNVTAATYLAHCQQEKTMATIRGFDSVIDYLLFEQRISRKLYDRQIDVIMKDLAPIMRRYAKLLKKMHNLDEIRYEDLKIELDGEFSKSISVEEAKSMIKDGLSILGDEYTEMVDRAFNERWIDFVNNIGKSTGAFCASPYGAHPYILISWSGTMNETMVLAHELGHAGHFYLNQQCQNILDTRPSKYFIEAPSTTNELIMANYLVNNAKDSREKRYYLSQIISRTYYHNFVTHLLEAAFQREVYYLIDEGKSFSADDLSNIFLKVLKEFWGDDIVLTKGAELTWMRQPHYYMGLYPYTYSAGLTIGTEVSQNILKNGKTAVDKWLDTLKLGGTRDSIDLAKNAGVDITTDEPLKNTIQYIDEIVTELEKLT